jgi:hypothetical protein
MHMYKPSGESSPEDESCEMIQVLPGVTYCPRHQSVLVVRDLTSPTPSEESWFSGHDVEVAGRLFDWADYHDVKVRLVQCCWSWEVPRHA